MLRVKDIQDRLLHLIGWQQNYDTSQLKVSNTLTETESGLYYQQAHPLLTLDNISSIAPDFRNTVYDEYSEEVAYSRDQIVTHDGLIYKAVRNSVGRKLTDKYYWAETSPFSEWLEEKTKSCIYKAVSRFYAERLSSGISKDLCEKKSLFEGAGRIFDTIKNQSNLVGFELVPVRSNGVTVKINKIGLNFTKGGEYTIYIFHSSSETPVYTLKLNKFKSNTIEWFDVEDIYLPYMSDYNDAGGSWFVCYLQDNLPVGSMAIRKERDWSKGPCSSCSRREYISWQAWSKYLEVHPFFVNSEFVNPKSEYNSDFSNDFSNSSISLWDVSKNQYTYDTNYGLNLEVSVSCDLTDFVISQRHLFTDIIMKQMAVDMLKEFAYNANVRTNRHSVNVSRLDVLYELDGDSSSFKNTGLCSSLDLAYKALQVSLSGIDRVCLPCKNNGIKYRVV